MDDRYVVIRIYHGPDDYVDHTQTRGDLVDGPYDTIEEAFEANYPERLGTGRFRTIAVCPGGARRALTHREKGLLSGLYFRAYDGGVA